MYKAETGIESVNQKFSIFSLSVKLKKVLENSNPSERIGCTAFQRKSADFPEEQI